MTLLRAVVHASGIEAGMHCRITTSPDQRWMAQMARNMSLADESFLKGCRYLLHDRDTKFCTALHWGSWKLSGIKTVKLPPRSPEFER